jgi:hypothetical protein
MTEIQKEPFKIPTVDEFNLDRSMDSLYHICLQYYTTLKLKNHPKINLITAVMDLLIELRKDKSLDEKQAKQAFDDIHSVAYKNIEHIYDYDKEHAPPKPIEVDEVKTEDENSNVMASSDCCNQA